MKKILSKMIAVLLALVIVVSSSSLAIFASANATGVEGGVSFVVHDEPGNGDEPGDIDIPNDMDEPGNIDEPIDDDEPSSGDELIDDILPAYYPIVTLTTMNPGNYFVEFTNLPANSATMLLTQVRGNAHGFAGNATYEFAVWARGNGGVRLHILDAGWGSIAYQDFELTSDWTRHSFQLPIGSESGVVVVIRQRWHSNETTLLQIDDAFFGLPDGANLLYNGGFEDFNIGGEIHWWGMQNSYTNIRSHNAVEPPTMNRGNYFVEFTNLPSGAMPHLLTQSRPATSFAGNETYEIAVWARGEGGFRLQLSGVDTTGAIYRDFTLTQEWQRFSHTIDIGNPSNAYFVIQDHWGATSKLQVNDAFFGRPGGTNILYNSGFEDFNTGGSIHWWGGLGYPANYVHIRPHELIANQPTQLPDGDWFVWADMLHPHQVLIDHLHVHTPANDYLFAVWARGSGPLRIYVSNNAINYTYTYGIMNLSSDWQQLIVPFDARGINEVILRIGAGSLDVNFLMLDNVYFGPVGGDFVTDNLINNPGFEDGPDRRAFHIGYGGVNYRPFPLWRNHSGRPLADVIRQVGARITSFPSGDWFVGVDNRTANTPILEQTVPVSSGRIKVALYARGEGNLEFGITDGTNSPSMEVNLTDYWFKHSFYVDAGDIGSPVTFYINAGSEGFTSLNIDYTILSVNDGPNLLSNHDFAYGPDRLMFDVPGQWNILGGLTTAIIRPTVPDPNLLQNPSFEYNHDRFYYSRPDFDDNWWIFAPRNSSIVIDDINGTFYGDWFVAIRDLAGSSDFVGQQVAIEPGVTYEASVWARGTGTLQLSAIGGGWDGTTRAEESFNLNQNQWTRFALPVTFNENGSYTIAAFIIGGTGTGYIYFDNADFRERVFRTDRGHPIPEGAFVPTDGDWILEWYDNFEGTTEDAFGPSGDWFHWNSWGHNIRHAAFHDPQHAFVRDGRLVLRSTVDYLTEEEYALISRDPTFFLPMYYDRIKPGLPVARTAWASTYNDANPFVINQAFGPGRYFEISARFDEFRAYGQWFAFWLQDAPTTGTTYDGDPSTGGEIDILELIRWHYPHRSEIHPAFHLGQGLSWNGYWSEDPAEGGYWGMYNTYVWHGFDVFDGNYHTFGAAWLNDRIDFFVNGINYLSITDPQYVIQGESQGIILSIEMRDFGWGPERIFTETFFDPPGGNRGENDGRDNYVFIDYVRVFELVDDNLPWGPVFDAPALSGEWMVSNNGTNTDARLSQTVFIAEPGTYEFSVFGRGNGTLNIGVEGMQDITILPFTNVYIRDPRIVWQQATHTFTVDAPGYVTIYMFNTGEDNIYRRGGRSGASNFRGFHIDDASLTRAGGGANLLIDPGFEDGKWFFQGDVGQGWMICGSRDTWHVVQYQVIEEPCCPYYPDCECDKPVCREDLGAALKYVRELSHGDFTRLSWALLHQVYIQAAALYNNQHATVQELEDMTARLWDAIDGLILTAPPPPPEADKAPLIAAIELAENFVVGEFTRLNWVLLQDALNHARLVVDNEHATQAQVDAALLRLTTAKTARIT
ncbi:MAG: carbohydrate binding domain-containing protein [Defluviitaleaceae bacterium]|nr:carbohydrate binding domain-containing protein [Defluviitaleaceae bacterium]